MVWNGGIIFYCFASAKNDKFTGLFFFGFFCGSLLGDFLVEGAFVLFGDEVWNEVNILADFRG